jgi:hypothetical protein
MSNKELQEDLNYLRIKYGTIPLYRTLIKVLRDEYEELSSLFCNTPNSHPTSTFYPSNPADYYSEFMEVAAQAAHDTLQEYPPVQSFYDLEAESITEEDGVSLAPEISPEDDLELINQIFNDNNSYSAPPETPTGESADTPQEPLLKIIQAGGASAAPEASPKKKLLKKKTPTTETVEVVKETTPAPIKKKKNTST